jgi:hypothetical protein
MTEPNLGGMQHQAVAPGSIEFVAHDGPSEAVGMGTVDAQLVCAAGLGIECYQERGMKGEG